jgi:hypothetical protein
LFLLSQGEKRGVFAPFEKRHSRFAFVRSSDKNTADRRADRQREALFFNMMMRPEG